MSAAYNKYTAVVETELLPAEKRAQKERSKFRVKRERLEILHPLSHFPKLPKVPISESA
jgi:hypothetical protein